MEEDIEYLKKLMQPPLREEWDFAYKLDKTSAKAIENILNRLEQDEKVIEEMAKAWKQDDIRSIEEIIDHFRKKCK